MISFLLPLVFLLVSAVFIPETYLALKTGRVRLRGGAILKKEEHVSRYWLSVLAEACVAIIVLSIGVTGLIAAIKALALK